MFNEAEWAVNIGGKEGEGDSMKNVLKRNLCCSGQETAVYVGRNQEIPPGGGLIQSIPTPKAETLKGGQIVFHN